MARLLEENLKREPAERKVGKDEEMDAEEGETGAKPKKEMKGYDILLERNKSNLLTDAEKLELAKLRTEADRFMLRKAHAATLLRWRGHDLSAM